MTVLLTRHSCLQRVLLSFEKCWEKLMESSKHQTPRNIYVKYHHQLGTRITVRSGSLSPLFSLHITHLLGSSACQISEFSQFSCSPCFPSCLENLILLQFPEQLLSFAFQDPSKLSSVPGNI